MMLARNNGRRYTDVGVPRLSRIDEEQVDHPFNHVGSESPMSSCSSSQSTPLPPFPSPPFLPTPPPMSTGIEMTTPPPPPPPDDYPTSSSLSMMTRLNTVDVDSVVYSRVDEHRRVTRGLPGDVVRLQMPVKSTDMIGLEKEATAVRYIKEKYDSLGKALIDRTLTYDTPLPIPSNVDAVGSGVGAKLLVEAPLATTTAEAPLRFTSPYQVPSSVPCCRTTMQPTVSTANQSCSSSSSSSSSISCGGTSVAVVTRGMSLTENCCQPQVGCQFQMQHATTAQSCQHHQQKHTQQHQQQQQQLPHQHHHHQCGYHGSHAVLQSTRDVAHHAPTDVRDLVPNASCPSSKIVEKNDASTTSKGTTTPDGQQDARLCCRHQHRTSFADLPSSPERQVEHSQHGVAKLPVTSSAASSPLGDAESVHSLVLTDHEETQIDLFYRSHKTLVNVSQCIARLSLSSPIADHTSDVASNVDPNCLSSTSAGTTQSTDVVALPPSALDERNWTPTPVTGVPVAVLDSGSGRRSRCLSIVVAERGTGFEMWRTSIDRLSTDYYRFDRASSTAVSAVPDVAANSASTTVHHVVCVRECTKTENGDRRTSAGPPVRWARLSFEYQKEAGEFARQLERMVADVDGVGRTDINGGIKGELPKTKNSASVATASKDARQRPVTGKKKSGSFRKADISQPCCFSHVTRIERSGEATPGGVGSPSTSGSGLRGILRGGFGGAMRGLAAAVSSGTGYDATDKDGTSCHR